MSKVLRKDERGISAVIVVVSLLGIFGAALLSLDAGNMWQTRRNIITATDATALNQAAILAHAAPGSGCQDTWEDLLLQNGGSGSTAIDCVATWGSDGLGYVAVDGRKLAATRFGGLFGIGDTQPYSYSVAQWGFPTTAKGLRPIGICKDNQHFVEWMNYKTDPTYKSTYENLSTTDPANHPTYAEAENTVHRLFIDHMNDQPCGGAPGNWGWLGFDGVPADPNEIADWLRNGWNEDVTIRVASEPPCPPGKGDADDSAEGCVPSDSGIGGSSAVNSALDFLLGKPIYILVFDVADCTPSGGKGKGGGGVGCDFEAYTFLNVTLRGFDLTGNPKYMDFEFIDHIISGKCCAGSPPNGVDAGGRTVALCDVDHSKFQRNETTTNPCEL